ncbi:tail fiber domain-containing protein [Staphylococcus pseudintermedius]|nr:tail fiber domain-containing protein [Staphylococcus pseudintermedius]
MIHVMNFKGEIVDFISQSDSAVIQAVHKRDINERIETFDFTILSERTTHMQERNRIIIQDKDKQYREFIIDRISADIDGYTEVETVASYLEDITKARPYVPGKLEKMTTKQALSDVLKDTSWQVSDATEYDGLRTTSWTSYQTRYDVLLQLCTTYDMMADFYIEVGSNRVDKRLVVLRKRNPLFKGKEIEYGKDLIGLKRTVDFSEIKTALLCVGPEPEEGKKRIELVVKDDESQAKYGLPGRYNWGVYEPETEDQNMTESRLRTLGTTELNKRKSEVITYEVTAVDIEKEFKHEIINLGDMVRIKNRDFTPPLYVEAEVISEEYDLISKDVNYGFGTYKEFKESDLRSSFDRKLDAIRQKVTDGFSNVNTIVRESLEGELQHFERKIFKGSEPPENPVNDMLWLDTRNPDVAVLRRYWEGQWINATAEKAEDIGAITREKALYSELSNTFVNLSIQHSKLLNDMHEILNNEYFVDFELKQELNNTLDETVNVFKHIQSNLESMNEETATIGKLIDTQSLFLSYRERMQALYNVVERAKVAIDERFELLQSQYTDEKFKEVLNNVADKLGLTVNEDNQLVGEIDVSKQIDESVREMTNQMLRDYVTSSQYQSDKQGIIERLESSDSERKQLADRISDTVTKSEYENDVAQKLSTTKAEVLIEAEQLSNRVSKEVFNAKSKTLERYTSEFINNVSDGITFRYDENGNIQSYSIGPQGVKIDATKFEINDGDVVVKNGITTIKDAYIDKLFSKQATIEYLKAIDVDLNKATVSGTRNGESTTLSGGKIRSTGTFTRTFPQGNATYEAFTESWNGVYRSGLISKQFGNRRLDNVERWLALTDKEITTQREVHSMSPDKRGARFIDFFAEETYSSDVYGQGMHIYSGQDLKIEAGYRLSFESSNSWYTQFSGSGVEIINDGASLVLKRQTGFTSQQGSGGQYISLQASDGAVHGHLGIMSDNRHMVFSSTFGEVHLRGDITKVFNANGSNLSDIRARSFDLSGVGRIAFENGDAYLQGQTGVRFTKYKSNTFVTAQAKDFVKASSRTLKTNIKDLKNGLSTIKELKPVSYDYISDLQEGNTSGDIGFISEDSPSISVENGKAISVQKVATWAILGIQELIKENERLNNQIKDLKDKFDVMTNNWKELNNE